MREAMGKQKRNLNMWYVHSIDQRIHVFVESGLLYTDSQGKMEDQLARLGFDQVMTCSAEARKY